MDMSTKKNNSDWQTAFDASEDIIALISKDFKILNINKTGCERIKKNSNELIGQKCYRVVHGLNSPPENCACQKAIKAGIHSSCELSEHGRRYITTASPIFDKNNVITAFTHTVKDITEKHEIENRLLKTNLEMEKEINLRTQKLLKINERLVKEIEERKNVEKKLKESQRKLEKKNIALSELITQIEIEKRKIKSEIQTNIEYSIMPVLENYCQEPEFKELGKIIKFQLDNISSSYGIKITNPKLNLTPREIEICNLIKSGMSSKDISKRLYISIKTIDKHRRNIRKKMDITNTKINLSSYLHDI